MKLFFAALLSVVLLSGCATNDLTKEPLRVGLSPDYPPMTFTQDGQPTGLEHDLMLKLGRELGRTITAVILPWNELIDNLAAGKVDIVMAGLTVTKARSVKIVFSDPWMKSGLMAAMRTQDVNDFSSADDIINFTGNIGVVVNTTGHEFAKRNCKSARVIRISSSSDGGLQLKRRAVDLFIDDIPSVAWQVSSNEGSLSLLKESLKQEDIAWGLRRGDDALLEQVNTAIQKWRNDGSLNKAINQWIPYYNDIKK